MGLGFGRAVAWAVPFAQWPPPPCASSRPLCPVQGHQPRSRPQAGGGDPDIVPQAHRQYRPHLLRLLHHLRHPGGAGGQPACSWVSCARDSGLWSTATGQPPEGPASPLTLLPQEAPCGGWWTGGHRVGPLDDRLPRQLFKGKFYYCEGADTRNISTRAECRAAHYRWVRRKYNFDNLGQVGRGRAGGRGGQRSGVRAGRDLECPEVFSPGGLILAPLRGEKGGTTRLRRQGRSCMGGPWGNPGQEAVRSNHPCCGPTGADVPVRAVLQGRLGEHHVRRAGRCGHRPAGADRQWAAWPSERTL